MGDGVGGIQERYTIKLFLISICFIVKKHSFCPKLCVINNITIATADDITIVSDDVNIYPVDLSGTINTLGNVLIAEKSSYFRPVFFSFVFNGKLIPLS